MADLQKKQTDDNIRKRLGELENENRELKKRLNDAEENNRVLLDSVCFFYKFGGKSYNV